MSSHVKNDTNYTNEIYVVKWAISGCLWHRSGVLIREKLAKKVRKLLHKQTRELEKMLIKNLNDVIVMQNNGVVTSHYVDSFGFKELPAFLGNEYTTDYADNRSYADTFTAISRL